MCCGLDPHVQRRSNAYFSWQGGGREEGLPQLGSGMNWFKENAAAIQALSSLAALLVACLLAWLTARYVRLTREIATSSLEQVKHIREAARIIQRQNAVALDSLALRIRVCVSNLQTPKHKELRAFSSFTESDIADLERLARQVDDRAIKSASEAVKYLRVIHGIIQNAKNINEGLGWIPTEEEKKNWNTAIQGAHRMLQEVETACQHVAAI